MVASTGEVKKLHKNLIFNLFSNASFQHDEEEGIKEHKDTGKGNDACIDHRGL